LVEILPTVAGGYKARRASMRSDEQFETGMNPFRPRHRQVFGEWPTSDLDWTESNEVQAWIEYFTSRKAS
jgi:hypothetical protein